MWYSVLLLPLLISPTAASVPVYYPGDCCYQQFSDETPISYANTIMDCMMKPGAVALKVSVVVLITSSCSYGIPTNSPPSFTNLTFMGEGEMRGMQFPPIHLVLTVTGELKFDNIRLASEQKSIVEIGNNSDRLQIVLSLSNCIMVSGISIVSSINYCSIKVRNTEFNQKGDARSMLWIIGAQGGQLDIAVNSTISCIMNCRQPVVNARICASSKIEGVKLVKRGLERDSKPLLNFYGCSRGSSYGSIELKLWNNIFIGEVPETYNANWITLRGNYDYGPKVVLQDNDYSQLEESTQRGRVYRIYEEKHEAMVNSKFQVTRSSYRDTPSGWHDDSPLATGECLYGYKEKRDLTYVPIGKEKHTSLQGTSCNVCCSVKTSVEGPPQLGVTIAGCLRIAAANPDKNRGETIVVVLDDCPAGKYESPISSVKIAGEDRTDWQEWVAITFEEGDYPFVNGDHLITFKNIVFKKRTGAGDRVATIVLGRESAMNSDANVKMIRCYVDAGVVVKLRHDVHYNASDTTFNQGQTEPASLSLESGVNQVVELSECKLVDAFCKTVMNGKMCGDVTIRNTLLTKTTGPLCTEAAVDLTICGTSSPTLKIEGIVFHGQVANKEEAAWIKVQGSLKNYSKVILLNNDYRLLNESTQKGRIYRFHALDVTRQVTLSSLLTNWDVNTALATNICPDNKAPVLPIGSGIIGSQVVHQECSRLCCAVKTLDDEGYAYGVHFQGSSISECLLNAGVRAAWAIVEVFTPCLLGDTIHFGKADVVKSDTYSDDSKKAVITGKSEEEYVLASDAITFKNIRFSLARGAATPGAAIAVWKHTAPPEIAASPSEFGTHCACIEKSTDACYSSLWDAFDRLEEDRKLEKGRKLKKDRKLEKGRKLEKDRKQISAQKTIRIEGICKSYTNISGKVIKNVRGNVKILKKVGSEGPTVVFFSSVAVLRVMKRLYVGPGVVLQTPNAFGNEQSLNIAGASLNHVRIYVGQKSQKMEAKSFLNLHRARVHGCITIIVEQASRLKAVQTIFSGNPRIRSSKRSSKFKYSIRTRPPMITMIRSMFTREFEDTNSRIPMIRIGCAVGSIVKMFKCWFPDTKIGPAVEYCYCAGKLDIRYSTFGMGNTANYSLVHVTACNKKRAIKDRKGRVLLDGISFTDAPSSEVTSPRLGAITLNLHPMGPDVLVKDINYRGFQGRGGLAAVDSKPIFITMHCGYDGILLNKVKRNYDDMSYAREKDFGGSLTCVCAPYKVKTIPILPILMKEAFPHKNVRYSCSDEGSVLANGVAVPVGRTVDTTTSPVIHEDNLDSAAEDGDD